MCGLPVVVYKTGDILESMAIRQDGRVYNALNGKFTLAAWEDSRPPGAYPGKLRGGEDGISPGS